METDNGQGCEEDHACLLETDNGQDCEEGYALLVTDNGQDCEEGHYCWRLTMAKTVRKVMPVGD